MPDSTLVTEAHIIGTGVTGTQLHRRLVQAQGEPAVFPCNQEGKQHLQPIKSGNYSTVFSIGTASPRVLCEVLVPQFTNDLKVLE